jgi:hypothetical protein
VCDTCVGIEERVVWDRLVLRAAFERSTSSGDNVCLSDKAIRRSVSRTSPATKQSWQSYLYRILRMLTLTFGHAPLLRCFLHTSRKSGHKATS